MDLVCYLHPSWAPLIRPAPATRAWMDATQEAFAYRCLPLNIANAHGWEILCPYGFEAVWTGGTEPGAVVVTPDPGAQPERVATPLFGHGVMTFHIEGLFRTPPGWNMWVGGPPNRAKDAIAPLNGIVETDWPAFTFTMNWRFTRPDTPIRFEAMEPFSFIFPVERNALEAFEPRFAPLDADPELRRRYEEWSAARDAFQKRMQVDPPAAPTDRWQKHYYRGVDVSGQSHIDDHKSKLRLKGFDASATPRVPVAPAEDAPVAAPTPRRADEVSRLRLALAKRDWLLETLERQRALSPAAAMIERRAELAPEEFLERYYAVNRPVVLRGEMAAWPALKLWTPAYLKAKVGPAEVDGLDGQTRGFGALADRMADPATDAPTGVSSHGSVRNRQALAPLFEDLAALEKLLAPGATRAAADITIASRGVLSVLRYDPRNRLFAQIVGRSRVHILPPSETGRLRNDQGVLSPVADLENIPADLARDSQLASARVYGLRLEPGEILFLPLGWWRQVKSESFSVSLTCAEFRWSNDADRTFPAG